MLSATAKLGKRQLQLKNLEAFFDFALLLFLCALSLPAVNIVVHSCFYLWFSNSLYTFTDTSAV